MYDSWGPLKGTFPSIFWKPTDSASQHTANLNPGNNFRLIYIDFDMEDCKVATVALWGAFIVVKVRK